MCFTAFNESHCAKVHTMDDTMIPEVFMLARFCRIADGPDEVHMSQLGKMTVREINEG